MLLLAMVIAIALHSAREMALAGGGLYRNVHAVGETARIETLWEYARGLTARVPAELDLGKQSRFHAQLSESLQTIATLLAAERPNSDPALMQRIDDVQAGITVAGRSADEVFRLSGSFAQEQAVAVLDGSFAAAEAQVAERLDRLISFQRDAAAQGLAALNGARRAMAWMIGVGGVMAVALVGIIGTALARSICGRVELLTPIMRKLADGNLTVAIPFAGHRDEIGQMARAVEVFKQNALEAVRLAEEKKAARLARERRHAALERSIQEFGTSVAVIVAGLAGSTASMGEAAGSMSVAADGAHRRAIDTTERAGRSSEDLTSIAAAIEQLTVSVDEIARQVAAAAEVAHAATERAAWSHGMMRGLADAAARIGNAVRMIEGIAGQTNLLALNATIEAARAGDAGKGFAVVAGEVKALSRQTARATAEIEAQIAAVRDAAEDAVSAMDDIGAVIGRIDTVTVAISAAVEQQSTTTRDIASKLQSISLATSEVVLAMSEVVELADGAGHVSRTVLDGVSAIHREASSMRTEVDHFLVAVSNDRESAHG